MFEVLSTKEGVVLLVLGARYFFNLAVFSRMRRRALLHTELPPFPPQGRVAVVPNA